MRLALLLLALWVPVSVIVALALGQIFKATKP